MHRLALRVSPLTVLADVAAARRQFQALGFEPVETGLPGCVGLQAGGSYLILASRAHLAQDFPLGARLVEDGQTLPYIHVASLAEACRALPAGAVVLERVETRAGTQEALVEQDGRLMILAERLG